MKKVWFAFLLSFLTIWSGNSMDGSKGSFKDDVPMTFVLGTDKNYIVPTLVTIHSLLKNGVENELTNIIVLTNGLNKDDKTLFGKIVNEIIMGLKKSSKNVKLYFLDISQSEERNLWSGVFKNIDKKFAFFGKNISEKEIIKYKFLLPFCIKNYAMMFASDQETNSLSVSNPKSFDKVNIPHYMWLDSDILITQNISQLYKSCLGSGSGICSSNYYFLTHDLTRFGKGFFGGIGSIDVNRIDTENDGPPAFPWRFSGGVLFFNLKNVNDKLFFNGYNGNNMVGTIDDETFFGLCCREGYFGEGVFSFSPRYNCRPSMPAAAQETLGKLTEQKGEEAEELKKITNPKEIAIWHWDGMTKPWHVLWDGLFIKNEKGESNDDAIRTANQQWREEYEEVYNIVRGLGYNINAYLMISK